MRKHIRRVRDVGLRRVGIAVALLIAIISASVAGYFNSRNSTDQEAYFGDDSNADHVDVTAWITKVDAAAQILSVTIIGITPNGTLSDDGVWAKDATLTSDAVGNWRA